MRSYRIPVTSLQLALVLIPKSMATELPVLGNTSGKTSTTKLRKYRLAESLITVTDDGIAGSSLDHKIFSFPILAYVNFMLTNFKSTITEGSPYATPVRFGFPTTNYSIDPDGVFLQIHSKNVLNFLVPCFRKYLSIISDS